MYRNLSRRGILHVNRPSAARFNSTKSPAINLPCQASSARRPGAAPHVLATSETASGCIQAILREKAHFDMASLLDILHPGTFSRPPDPHHIPTVDGLSDILSRKSDRRSLIRLLPAVIENVERNTTSVPQANGILRLYFQELGRHGMIAGVGVLVDVFLRKVDSQLVSGLDYASLRGWYERLLHSLQSFASRPVVENGERNDIYMSLPKSLVDEVIRIFHHLAQKVASLPCGSDRRKQHKLGKRTLDHFFSPRYLSPELKDVLFIYCHENSIEITAWQWHQCFILAAREGDIAHAIENWKKKKRMVRRDSKGKRGRSDIENIMTGCNEGADLDPLILATSGASYRHLVATVEPYLKNTDSNDSRTPYAWSTLLTRLGYDRSINAKHLLEIADTIPPSQLSSPVVTPLMHGLILKHQPARAWEVWRTFCESAKPIDNIALAVASEACYLLTDIESAIAFVDLWSFRPWMGRTNLEKDRLIALDVQNVNILLSMCNRSSRPSIAFRLWEAMESRYGVYPDAISLTILLDTARYFMWSKRVDIRSRLRQLFGGEAELGDGDDEPDDTRDAAYNATYWSRGQASILLDPDEFQWKHEFGDVPPWRLARRIFRHVVLGNNPRLRSVKSPLDLHASLFSSELSSEHHADEDIYARLPDENARYTSIVPTARTFQSYVGLLIHNALEGEVSIALAWMKELGIKPTWITMVQALTRIGEVEGPRRRIREWGENGETRLVRDEELMRRWLEGWVGVENVPTADDVAANVRRLAKLEPVE
ncbi:hypothetical protein P7C73_g4961, partial [Tremellales sp. Uapishka_1]